jgi:SAM-dependent methyltransferase
MAATGILSTDIKEIVKRSYDKIAPEYLNWALSRSSPRLQYLKHLLSTLSLGSKVLELGCGAGVPVAQTLCQDENISKIVANDISEVQVELAMKNCQQWKDKIDFVAGDMMGLKFRECELDGVAAFYSIFHLPRTEQIEMMRRIHSWLKPGSIIVCNFAAGSSEALGSEGGIEAEENPVRWNYFNADMFWSGLGTEGTKKMISGAGFELLLADVRNANEDIDPSSELHDSDPDRDVEFLWIVARKAGEQP